MVGVDVLWNSEEFQYFFDSGINNSIMKGASRPLFQDITP